MRKKKSRRRGRKEKKGRRRGSSEMKSGGWGEEDSVIGLVIIGMFMV